MMLPCTDPREVAGLERGHREFAEAAHTRLIAHLKDETNFGAESEAGLDAIAVLVGTRSDKGMKTPLTY